MDETVGVVTTHVVVVVSDSDCEEFVDVTIIITAVVVKKAVTIKEDNAEDDIFVAVQQLKDPKTVPSAKIIEHTNGFFKKTQCNK